MAARFRLSRRQDLVGQDNDHEREETRFSPVTPNAIQDRVGMDFENRILTANRRRVDWRFTGSELRNETT